MALPDEESCHVCECSMHAEEYDSKLSHIRQEVVRNNIDSLKTLLDFSEWFKSKKRCESPLPLVPFHQRICDFHCNFNNVLHLAFWHHSFKAAQLLIEKGLDVNRQDYEGNTPLHIVYVSTGLIDKAEEAASILLYYGADPMIPNYKGQIPFDMFMHYYLFDCTLLEHLFYHTFDQHTEYIKAEPFLEAINKFDVHVFNEINKKPPKVVFADHKLRKFSIDLFTMNPHAMQLLIEHFDYVIKEFLDVSSECVIWSHYEDRFIENFDILWKSKLKVEFTNWLCNVDLKDGVWEIFHNTAHSAQKLLCLFLSYGVRFNETDLDMVYCKLGDCEMFKILLHMDLNQIVSSRRMSVIPKILYNISLDVPKMIKEREFFDRDLWELKAYFTIPSDLFVLRDGADVQNRCRVPLLLEMARNVFRKYFIERLGIRNAGQFYAFIKLLPMSSRFKAIITFERKLYY